MRALLVVDMQVGLFEGNSSRYDAEGAASVDLNVYEFNRDALLFYESLGFTTLRRWRTRPPDPARGREGC
jgi:ribosomal protein S18 acetylase RimI-like enzyme